MGVIGDIEKIGGGAAAGFALGGPGGALLGGTLGAAAAFGHRGGGPGRAHFVPIGDDERVPDQIHESPRKPPLGPEGS